MKRIMVTGAGAVLGQGIIKSLRMAQMPVEVLAYDPSPLSSGLYWADQAGLIPMANDAAYAAAIENILDQQRPDAVLVGTDVELNIFAEHRVEWERRFNTHILVSDPRVIAIADDKYLTAQFLAEHDLHPPMSALPEDKAELENLIETAGFPLIVKPRRGARAVGVSAVHDRSELWAAIADRKGLVIQQMAGPEEAEYTAGVLCFDGEVQAAITMRRDLRDGNTHRAYVGHHRDLEPFVRAVGAALNPFGPANFQFRVDESGLPRLFEINARFSGTTPMRAMAGFNEVEMCLHKILDGKTVGQPDIREGVILRHLEEQFIGTGRIDAMSGL